MKLAKGESKPKVETVKIELDLEKSVVEQLKAMEDFTKISKSEHVCIALKRYISQHKDYFPEG